MRYDSYILFIHTMVAAMKTDTCMYTKELKKCERDIGRIIIAYMKLSKEVC